MHRDLGDWCRQADVLRLNLTYEKYHSDQAKEYATHGFCRRILDIQHSTERIFHVLPPLQENPSQKNLLDATAHYHAILANCHGALDNLARTWIYEKAIQLPGDKKIPDSYFGLFQNHRFVRSSLPNLIIDSLTKGDEWLNYLQDFRHALAHRIPPYIVPRVMTLADGDLYNSLEQQIWSALQNQDLDLYRQLKLDQENIGKFEAWTLHSFSSNKGKIRLHPQVICDLATIVELGEVFRLSLFGEK